MPPDILTYSYASRMVYVTPGETYDVSPASRLLPLSETVLVLMLTSFSLQHAIDIAKESFVELKDVERDRISLEVHVLLKNQQTRRTAEIGRTAWSVVVASLARFEIVEIRLAPPPPGTPPKTAMGLSGSQSTSTEPPPYASDKASSWYSDSQSNLAPYRIGIASSQSSSSSSSSFAGRVVDLLTPKSSRGRLSPQPYHQF